MPLIQAVVFQQGVHRNRALVWKNMRESGGRSRELFKSALTGLRDGETIFSGSPDFSPEEPTRSSTNQKLGRQPPRSAFDRNRRRARRADEPLRDRMNSASGPSRLANPPRYSGQRNRFESWDIALAGDELGFWFSYGVVSDPSGRGLGTVTAVSPPARVFRAAAPNPHLMLVPPFVAGFDHERDPIFAFDSESVQGLDHLGAGLISGPGRGEVTESSVSGLIGSETGEISWEIEWKPGGETTFLVPTGPGVAKHIPYQLATRSSDLLMDGIIRVDGREIVLDRVHGSQTHAWGSQYPAKWASAICGDWDQADFSFDDGEQPLFVALLWLKSGPYGRFGPPVPKTFGVVRIGDGANPTNLWPYAIAASSSLDYPVWEARLVTPGAKFTIRIERDVETMTQIETRPRLWRSLGLDARIELTAERKSNGRWLPAGTASSSRCRIELGGNKPDPRSAVID